MARRSLRARALVALMFGVALSFAATACAQKAADPFAAPPAAAPATAVAKPARAGDPFGASPAPAPAATPRAAAPAAVRATAPAVQAADDGPFSAAAASAGLRTQGLAEARIRHALDGKTDCDFTETPLNDVLDYFKSKHDIQIQGDKKALQDAAIDGSQPITLQLKGVTLKSALRLILDELDLAYVIRDEVLLVTTKDVAASLRETRTYPVQDLLTRWPAGTLRGRDLVRMITAVVEPETWDESGGSGAVELLPGTLVVSQTQAVHSELADLLALLRRTRKAEAHELEADTRHGSAGDAKTAAKPMRIAAYRVLNIDGASLRDAIVAVIAPQTWKENGGEGTIQLVRAAIEEKAASKSEKPTSRAAGAPAVTSVIPVVDGQSGASKGAVQVLIVRQTDDVHDAIEDLLEDIGGQQAPFVISALGGGLFRIPRQ
jgi:hypothetical protein